MSRREKHGFGGFDFVNIGLVLIGAFLACMPSCITVPLGFGLIGYGVYRIRSGR